MGYNFNYPASTEKKVTMNNKYTIKIGEPLLRPGLEITTECSERYVNPVVDKVMEIVRQINSKD